METENNKNSYENGNRTWQAIQSQFEEGRGFLGGILASLKKYVRKYFLSYVLFGLVFALIGGAVIFVKPKLYEANMTVSYVHYEKKIYADMLEKLNLLIQAGKFNTLSELLELPEQSVKSIKSITGYNIRNEELVDDLGVEKIPFYITIRVSDPEIITPLETSLLDYLNNTEFIQERLKYMKKRSLDELAFLEKRLAVVDSLSGILLINENDLNDEKAITRMELLEEAMTIFNRIQEVKGSLVFNLNLEVLDGFIAPGRIVSKGIKHWLLYGFLFGLALRWVLIVFKKN